jgi:uncharacterized protein
VSTSLFDVNVWVAMAFGSHPHFKLAEQAFEERNSRNPVVFCRATQQAFLRLLSSPLLQKAYGVVQTSNAVVWAKWQELSRLPQVRWMEEPPELAALWAQSACRDTASPKVWMDAYLAAFAIAGGLRLVTLDHDFKSYETHGLDLILLNP